MASGVPSWSMRPCTMMAARGHLVAGRAPHGQRRGHELLDEQDGHALPRQVGNQFVELGHDQRGQAHGQLVEQQHPGVGDQCPRDCQHLLLTAGQGSGHLPPPFLQAGEGGVGLLLHVLERDPAAVGPDAQVLAYVQIGEDPPSLGNRAQTVTGESFG
jgi:hypothetical protein